MGPRSIRMRTAGAVLVVAAVTAACGSSSDNTTAKAAKTVVIGSAPFSENEIVANMYAGALQNAGYQVTVRKGLGQREIYLPALQKGGKDNGIDLVPEYVGTLLEYLNKGAGEATSDLDATMGKLRPRLDTIGVSALTPSSAADQNAFAVTKATADRLKAKKLSDLTPVASQLTLGAGSECPDRPFCQPGLEKVYGLKFKAFRSLDTAGPKTLEALASGDIDVGLVFSTGGGVAAKNLVVLEDDKKLQTVDNIVPAIRKDVVDDTITSVLNKVSAALNTPDITQLNKRADIDKEDPETLAQEWLGQHGFTKKK
jgi:osmoprotectant transport system substrate-binding protein